MTSPKRPLPWLIAGAWILIAIAPVQGQNYPDDPRIFPPGDISDGELFQRPDTSPYGGHLHPGSPEGFFLDVQGLAWTIQRPDVTYIGVPPPTTREVWVGTDAIRQLESSDTSTEAIKTKIDTGARFEFGYAGQEDGWLCDVFVLSPLTQTFTSLDANVVFNDPVIGLYNERRLQGGFPHVAGAPTYPDMPQPPYMVGTNEVLLNVPTNFSTMNVVNKTSIYNVELMYLRRFHQLDNFEIYMGARYFNFSENFQVQGLGGTLGSSYWMTEAHNQIIGPEIAARWAQERGRWKLSVDGRFLAGANIQAVTQEGELGRDIKGPPAVLGLDPATGTYDNAGQIWFMSPTEFDTSANTTVFSPLVELRAELSYKLTKAVNFKVGFNGIWVDGIARPSALINYTVPNMGINMSNNYQSVFMAGVNVGVEINR
jgi:hypothetical protein